jgi:dipeptidyl aminopeptidase/acylaminoacyl peptidase
MRRAAATLVFVCSSVVLAEAPRPADLFALKTVSDAQVSPDGRSVAYVVGAWDFKENLVDTDVWLADVATGAARRLTNSPKRDERPRFSPDGRTIAFLSERRAEEKDAKDVRQIWLIARDGGEASRLTSAASPVASFAWSPDGKRIAFTSPVAPAPDEKKRRDEKDDASVVDVDDVKPAALWIADVATKSVVRVSAPGVHVASAEWSPDGARLAGAVSATPKVPDSFNTDLVVWEAKENGKASDLVKRPGPDSNPAFSPDGKWVAFFSGDGRVNDWPGHRTEICVVSADGGAVRNLTRAADLEADDFAWTPDSSTIVFAAPQRITTQIFSVSLAGGAPRPLTKGAHVLGSISSSADGKTLAFVQQSASEPPEVAVLAPSGAPSAPRRLTSTNPSFAGALRPKVEVVSWNGPGGLPIEGILHLPPDRPAAKLPFILNIHGGPAGRFALNNSAFSRIYPIDAFVARGIAVLQVNPRGSSGYGEAFKKANVRDWGGKDYLDLMAGVDMLVEKGVVDPARMGVMGWSYGGFMTSWILTHTDRFRFASPGAPVTDLWSFYYSADIPEFIESYFGGMPWDDFEVLREHSPMWFVKAAKTPTLILHGDADVRVPPAQGRALYLALRKRGVPVELVTYAREPHGPAEPKHVKDIRARLLAWTDRYLGTAAPGAPAPAAPAPTVKAPAAAVGGASHAP